MTFLVALEEKSFVRVSSPLLPGTLTECQRSRVLFTETLSKIILPGDRQKPISRKIWSEVGVGLKIPFQTFTTI